MSYYNIRNKQGRFAKKTKAQKRTTTKTKKYEGVYNVFLLDDSASMLVKKSATIEGFNSVLMTNKKAATINKLKNVEALAKFGTNTEYAWKGNNVQALTSSTYHPSQGSTALWDAVIKTIANAEVNIPIGKYSVNLTIFTDGLNNELAHLQNKANAEVERKKRDGWVINFIGAGDQQEMEAVASSIGIFTSNTLGYQNTSAGTRGAMKTFNEAKTSYMSNVSKGKVTTDGFFSNE